MPQWLTDNRASWEFATRETAKSPEIVAKNLSEGRRYLPKWMTREISKHNPKRVIHLFCNDGRETIGVEMDTKADIYGIDFSRSAINLARSTATELRSRANFIEQEVSLWLPQREVVNVDVSFSTLGSVWWISKLDSYFLDLARLTSPGGVYLLWEFHPLIHTLDDELLTIADYPFKRQKRAHAGGIEDYYQDLFAHQSTKPSRWQHNPYPATDYLWGIADIVNAAAKSGWSIGWLREWPYVYGERYLIGLVCRRRFQFGMPSNRPRIPLTMAIGFYLQNKARRN